MNARTYTQLVIKLTKALESARMGDLGRSSHIVAAVNEDIVTMANQGVDIPESLRGLLQEASCAVNAYDKVQRLEDTRANLQENIQVLQRQIDDGASYFAQKWGLN